MEANNLNPIPRLEAVGDAEWDGPGGSGLLGRLAWLIFGFNVGFMMMLGLAFALSAALPDFGLHRAESANPPEDIIILAPNESELTALAIQPSPTLTEITPTDVLVEESQAVQVEVSATVNVKATARANSALTQEAVLALTPTTTDTPFPTATDIPPTTTPIPPPTSHYLDGISFFRQGWNNCGPANLAMGLSFYDWGGNQDDTAAWLKPNNEDKNVTPQQMVDYVNQFTNLRAMWRMAGTLDQLKWLVGNNFMVIVESGYEPGGEGWFGHYETVVGYDSSRSTITIYDSYLGRSSRPSIVYSESQFDRQWQTFNRNFIVIYPPNREQELITFMGEDWYDRNNRARAVRVAQQEASESPNNAFIWFNLGTSLTSLGRYEEAVVAFNRAFEIGLPYRMLWYQFMPYEAYLQTGRFDNVIDLANNTLRTTRYVEETFYFKGRAYELQGDYGSAQVEYENALTFNPNHSQAQAALRRVEAYQ